MPSPVNPRPEYAPRNAPLRPNDKNSLRAYPRLIRTIVFCGVAVASLLACSTTPTSSSGASRPPFALDPTPTAKTVGLFLNEPKAFAGYTLFNKIRNRTVYLIDNQGQVVHRWELDVEPLFTRLLENGNLLALRQQELALRQQENDAHGKVTEVDRNGHTLWECTQGIQKWPRKFEQHVKV